MDWQLPTVIGLIAVSLAYISWATWRTWAGSSGGCGSGCGKCAKPKHLAERDDYKQSKRIPLTQVHDH